MFRHMLETKYIEQNVADAIQFAISCRYFYFVPYLTNSYMYMFLMRI